MSDDLSSPNPETPSEADGEAPQKKGNVAVGCLILAVLGLALFGGCALLVGKAAEDTTPAEPPLSEVGEQDEFYSEAYERFAMEFPQAVANRWDKAVDHNIENTCYDIAQGEDPSLVAQRVIARFQGGTSDWVATPEEAAQIVAFLQTSDVCDQYR